MLYVYIERQSKWSMPYIHVYARNEIILKHNYNEIFVVVITIRLTYSITDVVKIVCKYNLDNDEGRLCEVETNWTNYNNNNKRC